MVVGLDMSVDFIHDECVPGAWSAMSILGVFLYKFVFNSGRIYTHWSVAH